MTVKQLRFGGGLLMALAVFQLSTRGVSGPFTALLLYGTLAVGAAVFLVGEAIALRAWLRGRADPPAPGDQSGTTAAEMQPAWMGDPAGNRRRLKIILIAVALLGVIAAILIRMQ
jgi:hypothetical protein